MNISGCEYVSLLNDGDLYVTCGGNFSEIESVKQHLEDITGTITVFELQNASLDVLPPDMFQNVSNHKVRKVIFDNVSIELLEVPELGDSPFKSIKDTVESLQIYYSSKVFAWNFATLKFENLQNFIIEDSELISLTVPLFFWPELQFIQLQNSSLRWIHPAAFKGNRKLAIISLAHNKISSVSRSMFPTPAYKLYSLDLR